MDVKKIDIKRKITVAIICSITFGVVYNLNAWYASTLAYVPTFIFRFEKYIPFMSWTIVPYLTSGIFFSTVFFFCKNNEQLANLSKRLLFIILVAGTVYLIIPLKFSFIRPVGENTLFQFLFQFLENVDSPYNEAPSLHIAFAFIFWTVFRNFNKKWRNVLAVWLVLLGLSTLTTYQHHLIDVLTGAILAQISFITFPAKENNFQLRNFHIANYYFLAGWLIALLSLILYEFYHPFYLILLWPSVILFLVGYHYQKNHVHFLKDRVGSIVWYKKLLYFPYLAIYWFFWKFLRKNKKPIEILSGIYISSKLDTTEIQNFNFNQTDFIYDFSAELEENSILKEGTQYFSVPLLDIGAFDVIEIKRIVLEISENYKQLPPGGKILIHCTMGYTRSTFIGILVVKNILSLPLEAAITEIKNKHKNAVIHSYLQDFLKTIN